MRLFVASLFLLVCSFANAQQQYPNIDGEILLDDDRVVVQRFVLEPGQWEGIHEHPEYQLVIVLNATDELTSRFRGTERVFPGTGDTGSESIDAFWRQGPVFISDQHESGNTGSRPLEWIAITFKSDSVVTDDPPVQIVEE
jgi:predicted metal-dependent enzyme (double-stranded beta helix superfamily)